MAATSRKVTFTHPAEKEVCRLLAWLVGELTASRRLLPPDIVVTISFQQKVTEAL